MWLQTICVEEDPAVQAINVHLSVSSVLQNVHMKFASLSKLVKMELRDSQRKPQTLQPPRGMSTITD